jgi:signal transduction histidine kinase
MIYIVDDELGRDPMKLSFDFLKRIKVRIALTFSALFLAFAIPAIIYAFNQVEIFFEGTYLQQMRVAGLTAGALYRSNFLINPDSLVSDISELTATSVFLISPGGQILARHYDDSSLESLAVLSNPIGKTQGIASDSTAHKLITIGRQRFLQLQTTLSGGDRLLQVKSFSKVSMLKARMREVIFWSSFLGLLALVAVAFWVSANITKQLERLTAFAQKIRLGQSPNKIELKSPDEVGELADALNDIVDNLNQAKDSLIRLEQTQRDFFGQIGERLEQPLLAIGSRLKNIIDTADSLDTSSLERLQTALQQAKKVQEIIRTLIEISQLEYGEAPLNIRPLHLHEIVDDVAGCFRAEAARKGLRLETFYCSDNIKVLADEKWLKIALDNLLSNAVDFTDKGSIKLTCELNEQIVRIIIEDTGRGIPQNQVDRIFERFYRVESADAHDRAGLGLVLAKEIIRAHGQKLDVESKLGVGSRFTFTLEIQDQSI